MKYTIPVFTFIISYFFLQYSVCEMIMSFEKLHSFATINDMYLQHFQIILCISIIDRPGVGGAVLQTALSLFD